MAKKKATHKSGSKSSKSKPKAKTTAKPKSTPPSSKKKYKKKRGRKPSTPNRYNAIKSAIANYYQTTIGRNVKRFEMKVIYQWVKQEYGNQSVKYVVMNIDLIIDTFWKEYCNLYPVDLQNHARLFDWYYLKDYLSEEKEYHYPTDVIQVDLTAIGGEVLEFFMEDYVAKCDEYYAICTELGIRSYDYPRIFLKDAFCDISKKGNLYQYVLVLEDEGDVSGEKGQNKPLGSDKPKSEGLGSPIGESSSTGLKSSQEVGTGAVATRTGAVATGAVETESEISKEQEAIGNQQQAISKEQQEALNAQIILSKQKEAEAIAQKQLIQQRLQTIIELKKLGFSNQEIVKILGE